MFSGPLLPIISNELSSGIAGQGTFRQTNIDWLKWVWGETESFIVISKIIDFIVKRFTCPFQNSPIYNFLRSYPRSCVFDLNFVSLLNINCRISKTSAKKRCHEQSINFRMSMIKLWITTYNYAFVIKINRREIKEYMPASYEK